MDAHAHHAHDAEHGDHHHEMPTEGAALTAVAISATLHCLTGCAIGEVAGMVIGTALGLSNFATIVLAIALAFLFGYTLTSIPLLRAGLAFAAVVPIAFASDTLSIATMEVVDNLVLVVIPGAMHAGLDTVLFWGSLSFALVIAGVIAVPVNRALLARGKGHAAVHETGIHGGPPVKAVAAVAAVAFVFGTTVLVAELVGEDEEHGGATLAEGSAASAPGLAVAESGLALELDRTRIDRGARSELSFRIVEDGDAPVRDFEVEHAKRMHLIVVRRDMTGFQHLHPTMAADGTWSTPIELDEAGSYRVFADFDRAGEDHTLGADLNVDGGFEAAPLPAPANTATTEDGYKVELAAADSVAGESSELTFTVTRAGEPVEVEPYLDADGHLVALREGDLAYLHTHPTETGDGAAHDPAIRFETEFPSEGRYRLFLQFKVGGKVHTAEFTREAAAGSASSEATPTPAHGGGH